MTNIQDYSWKSADDVKYKNGIIYIYKILVFCVYERISKNLDLESRDGPKKERDKAAAAKKKKKKKKKKKMNVNWLTFVFEYVNNTRCNQEVKRIRMCLDDITSRGIHQVKQSQNCNVHRTFLVLLT